MHDVAAPAKVDGAPAPAAISKNQAKRDKKAREGGTPGAPAVIRGLVAAAIVAGSDALIGGNTSAINSHLSCKVTSHNKTLASTARFAPDCDLCDTTLFEVAEDMWQTPPPWHDIEHLHTNEYAALDPIACVKNAVKRAKKLAKGVCKWMSDAAPAVNGIAPRLWLQDTGSGFDLVDRSRCDQFTLDQAEPLDIPLILIIANGECQIDQSVPIQIGQLLNTQKQYCWIVHLMLCPLDTDAWKRDMVLLGTVQSHSVVRFARPRRCHHD